MASTGFAFNANPFAASAGAAYSAVEALTYDGRGGNDSLLLNSGALTIVGNQTFQSFTVSGATASLAAGGHVLRSVNFSVTSGKFDISDGAVIIDYASSSPLSSIRTSLKSGRGPAGFGNATWAANGIMSTNAQADPISFAVGYAENSALPLGAYATWQGQSVDATTVIIKYTRGADANLDGLVNDDDVTILGAYYNDSAATAWYKGDFDYDNKPDDDDITVLGALYNPAGPPL
jgi:hypothetical protein